MYTVHCKNIPTLQLKKNMQTQNSHGCFGKQASDSAVLLVARLFLTPVTPELGCVRRELPGAAVGTELGSGQTKPEELSRAFLAE